MLDLLGRVVYAREVHDFTGEVTQDISLGSLPPAAYRLRLQNGNELNNKPFIITR